MGRVVCAQHGFRSIVRTEPTAKSLKLRFDSNNYSKYSVSRHFFPGTGKKMPGVNTSFIDLLYDTSQVLDKITQIEA
jgi:hypothetical protein